MRARQVCDFLIDPMKETLSLLIRDKNCFQGRAVFELPTIGTFIATRKTISGRKFMYLVKTVVWNSLRNF